MVDTARDFGRRAETIAPGAELVATSEYKPFDALRRNYPSYDHIVQADDFLRQHQAFLVHDPSRQWVKLRLTPDIYTVEELGQQQSTALRGKCSSLGKERTKDAKHHPGGCDQLLSISF